MLPIMLFIPDYHLQFTFGSQIRFRAASSGINSLIRLFPTHAFKEKTQHKGLYLAISFNQGKEESFQYYNGDNSEF